MTLKMSFINFGIVKHNLKRYWWVSALSFVVLFLSTVLKVIIFLNSNDIYNFEGFLNSDSGYILLTPSVSVLIAVCVLRYIQNPKNATLIHSMPPKRTTLFTSAFLSGIILFSLPVILTGIILALLSLNTNIHVLITLIDILRWGGAFLLYGLTFYSISMSVGVFTGSSIAQLIFTYIVLSFPLMITMLLSFLFDGWLYSYIAQTVNPVIESILNILPFHYVRANSDYYANVKGWQYVLMGVYIILSYLAGLFFYKKRKIEYSGDVIAFGFLKPVFLYGVSICFSLTGTLFVKALSGNVSLAAFVFFALLGYCIAKILLLKSFKIIKFYKGAIAVCCVMVAFWCVVQFNLLGYGKSVPSYEKIESAYIGSYLTSEWIDGEETIHFGNYADGAELKNEENVKELLEIHKKAVNGEYQVGFSETSANSIPKSYCIGYKLKNGKTIANEYIVESDEVNLLLSTTEAKEYVFPYIMKDSDVIETILISEDYTDFPKSLSKADEKAALVEVLKKDIEASQTHELFEYEKSAVHLEFILKTDDKSINGSAYISLNKNYKHTLEYIKNN